MYARGEGVGVGRSRHLRVFLVRQVEHVVVELLHARVAAEVRVDHDREVVRVVGAFDQAPTPRRVLRLVLRALEDDAVGAYRVVVERRPVAPPPGEGDEGVVWQVWTSRRRRGGRGSEEVRRTGRRRSCRQCRRVRRSC